MGNNKKQINSQVMALSQLISAPLIATLEADAMTTRSYINFLREIAFETDGNGGSLGKLRTFTFRYTQTERGTRVVKSVEIPVISLIPIPLLQIKEATFDFELKILDSMRQVSEESYSFENDQKTDDDDNMPLLMRAALAPQSGNSKNERDHSQSANMKVHVVMQQADMPSGLANLLSLSANNMTIEDESPDSPAPYVNNE